MIFTVRWEFFIVGIVSTEDSRFYTPTGTIYIFLQKYLYCTSTQTSTHLKQVKSLKDYTDVCRQRNGSGTWIDGPCIPP